MTQIKPMRPMRVAMFGVLRGEGVVMLSYNSAYIYNISNSPGTSPLPYTLNSIPYSHTLPMHMCIPL